MTGDQIRRVLLWAVSLALVFFLFLWIGFAVQSYRAYRAGERAAAEGSEVLAQGYFERSIRSHCPLNIWGQRSAARLEAMAAGYEEKKNIDRAVEVYEALMTALAAVDTGWSRSRREQISRLEQRVLALRREMAKASRAP